MSNDIDAGDHFNSTDRREKDFVHSVEMQSHLAKYIFDFFDADTVTIENIDEAGADAGGLNQKWDWWGVDIIVEEPDSRMPITCAYRGRRRRARGDTDLTLRYSTTGGAESEVDKWKRAYEGYGQLPTWLLFGIYPRENELEDGFEEVYLIDTERFMEAWIDGDLDYMGPYDNYDGEGTQLIAFSIDDLAERSITTDDPVILDAWK